MIKNLPAPGKLSLRAKKYFHYAWNINDSRRTFVKALNRDMLRIGCHLGDTRNLSRPLVALESTVYTHGWSYPENIELAFHLQDLVQSQGATPATIGIIDGVAIIGLSDREIVTLCSAAGKPETMKVSRRDLPFILGMGIAGRHIHGGTTVSGTMVLARMAGINVFGTGGLGGVHISGQDTLDISADLTELGRTPVTVISSGCKSFLDIGRTLEFLETQGATVATFADGRIGEVEFPEFYTRDSGVKSPLVVRNAKEAAAIVFSVNKLGYPRDSSPRPGILFANPIPEEFSIPRSGIIEAINQAVKEATDKGISGHQNTPFILARIKDLTEGRSVTANRALLESNVKMAAKISVELASLWAQEKYLRILAQNINIMASPLSSENSEKVRRQSRIKYHLVDQYERSVNRAPKKETLQNKTISTKSRNHPYESNDSDSITHDILGPSVTIEDSPSIVVFGAIAIDLTCNFVLNMNSAFSADLQPNMKTSNISRIEHSIGGVGHNVALAAHLVTGNQRVRLCSLVAEDLPGSMAINSLKSETLDIRGIKVLPKMIERSGALVPNPTAQYVAVNDGNKDLVLGMADMQIFRQNSYEISKSTMKTLRWAIIDANWNQKVVRELMTVIRTEFPEAKIAFEPVSEQKGAEIFRLPTNLDKNTETSNPIAVFPNHKIDLVTPNLGELNEMFFSARNFGYFDRKDHLKVIHSLGILGTQSNDRYREVAGEYFVEQGAPSRIIQLLPYMTTILTKSGPNGVLLTQIMRTGDPRLEDPRHKKWILSRTISNNMHISGIYMRLYPVVKEIDPAEIVSTNGAGDTFLGVLIAGLSRGLPLDKDLIEIAQKGAIMTLKCKQSVSPSLGEIKLNLDQLTRNFADSDPPNTFKPETRS